MFASTLVFHIIVFSVQLCLFTVIRPYFKAIYEPRTYIPPPPKRAQPLSRNMFLWPLAVWRVDYRAIKNANGMDAYFFVRFLRMMVKVFLPMWIISWAVLIPITTYHTSVPGASILDKFTSENLQPDKRHRYVGHLILSWIFTFWIFYNIKFEMRHFVVERQQHLMGTEHAKSLQANTILITGIPTDYLNQRSLRTLFEDLPGGVQQIWINRNLKALPDIYDRRLDARDKLEVAETTLLRTAVTLDLEKRKRERDGGGKTAGHGDTNEKNLAEFEAPLVGAAVVASIVPRNKRPTHRLGMVPLVGKKVDTIEWAREEIRKCNKRLAEGREELLSEDLVACRNEVWAENEGGGNGKPSESFRPSITVKEPAGLLGSATKLFGGLVFRGATGFEGVKYPPLNSAFITFNKQITAHLAMQVLAHHEPYRMSHKYNEVSPQDVIWANLNLNPYERKLRTALSYVATAALIIFWPVPVAFVNAISDVYTLCGTASWLAWTCDVPAKVGDIISDILSPIFFALLLTLLAIILRSLMRFSGTPKSSGVELSLMTRLFVLSIYTFSLLALDSDSLATLLYSLIYEPTSVPKLVTELLKRLAADLPKTSTFFLNYVMLQGLSSTAKGFLRISTLLLYYAKLFILGSTPRSVYSIKYVSNSVTWGTLFPDTTLLTVIGLAFSITSPVINALMCFTFFALHQLYKYLLLWVYEQSPSSDTGGLFFPKAIQHIFVGLYIKQICLCALFFNAHDPNDNASTIASGFFMIVLIVITGGFHIIINNSYSPLLYALPLSLKDKTYSPDEGISEGQHECSNTAGTTGHDIPKGACAVDHGTDDVNAADHDPQGKNKQPDNGTGTQDDTAKQMGDKEEVGFAHPAIRAPLGTVWIPRDVLGLGEGEVNECEEMGINASTQGAVMNGKGVVDVPTGDEVPEDIVASFKVLL